MCLLASDMRQVCKPGNSLYLLKMFKRNNVLFCFFTFDLKLGQLEQALLKVRKTGPQLAVTQFGIIMGKKILNVTSAQTHSFIQTVTGQNRKQQQK